MIVPDLATSICRDYAEMVFDRARTPLEPLDYKASWFDQPSPFKTYQEVERFPLPLRIPVQPTQLADVLNGAYSTSPAANHLSLEALSTILLLSHGALCRKLTINWNQDDRRLTQYHLAAHAYGRGTPSGGGLYPTEIYWISGASGPLLPGIYHYDNGHHALERLFTGDVTHQVRTATFHHPATAAADQFLLVTLNFWKSAFKYNSFCYHLVTQDLGALLCSLRLLAQAYASDLCFLSWFQDEALNHLLGLETLNESVFTVVPLNAPHGYAPPIHQPEMIPPQVSKKSFQRSRNIIHFPLSEHVHLATLLHNEPYPAEESFAHAMVDLLKSTAEPVPLPPPAFDRLQADMTQTFQQRKSSFGSFSAHVPLSREELATLLSSGASGGHYWADVKQENGSPSFTRLLVFVNHVTGIEQGIYAYDQEQHCLRVLQRGDFTLFLQKHYLLLNYNIAETGVVIAIVGSIDRMLTVFGARGYRLLNAEAGMIAQRMYLVATALKLGCGAVLGFDNRAMDQALGLDNTDQRSLLFLLAGHEHQGHADFNGRMI
ncbi:MAG TPA: SagB family peptide dehydrogenase [Ktedonosporobacter sp.]|nr:SagB family peptide dehydrogenase [Ktedonosporobacter sp.]